MQKKSKCQLIKQKNRHIVEYKIIHSIMDKDLLIIIPSKKVIFHDLDITYSQAKNFTDENSS